MTGLRIELPKGVSLTLERKALAVVLRGAGREIAARARALIRSGGATKKRAATRKTAAGDPPVSRTGNLARNIRATLFKSGRGVTVRDTARSPRGSGSPYALFLEKGTQGGVGSGRKGIRGKRNARKMVKGKNVRQAIIGSRHVPPHPFMGPALDAAAAADLGGRVRDAILDGIKFSRRS